MSKRKKKTEEVLILSLPKVLSSMTGVMYFEKHLKTLLYRAHYTDGTIHETSLNEDIPFNSDTNVFELIGIIQDKVTRRRTT